MSSIELKSRAKINLSIATKIACARKKRRWISFSRNDNADNRFI